MALMSRAQSHHLLLTRRLPSKAAHVVPRRRGVAHASGNGSAEFFTTLASIDYESAAQPFFSASLFPYLAFLYYLRKANVPRQVIFAFSSLLIFVVATAFAGVYAKSHYGYSLSNVDWLHGLAELFLTITNLWLVLALRQELRRRCNLDA